MTLPALTTYSLSLLSKEKISLFYEQGYLIVPALFNERELAELRNACDTLTQLGLAHQKTANDPDQRHSDRYMLYDRTTKFVYRRGLRDHMALSHVVGCGGIVPELHSHLRSPSLVHTFAALMGSSHLQHLLCQFHPKLPGSGIVFKPHRDIQHRINYAKRAGAEWDDINGEGSYVVGIIAVDAMDANNGALCALAGSHHPKPDLTNDTLLKLDNTTLQARPEYRCLSLQPGDMVLLHPYLLHWSGQNNTSDRTRYTLITGYAVAGANPNHDPKDYAGDSTQHLIRAHADGFQVEAAPWLGGTSITTT